MKEFQDKTSPSDCLVFYRPSFGRGNGAVGEFDEISVSTENIYLIESKWDNFSKSNNNTLNLELRQKLRHSIFSWHLQHWDDKYTNNWKLFLKEQGNAFQKEFKNRRIAPAGSLLANNLEFVLSKIRKHFRKTPTEQNIKNVLLFFHNGKDSSPPTKISKGFNLVAIDYPTAFGIHNFSPNTIRLPLSLKSYTKANFWKT